VKLRAQQILLPCISFGARARVVATSNTLTPIELVALKAIGAGLDDVAALSQVMGIGHRPVLDLIYDFWLKGYVVVLATESKVQLAGEAKKAHARGGLEELATAENNLEVVPLIQELVSGAVLPHIGRQTPFGPESSLVPTLQSGLSLERVTRGELLDAVQREIERHARKLGRPLVAQEAWVEPDQLLLEASGGALVQQRRFLPLVVDISQDSDSERLIFDIVDAPEVPPPVRKAIARSLSLLAERLPDQLFFKRFREEFGRDPRADEPSSSVSMLQRLGWSVQSLEATDPGVLEQRHAQLVQLHREAAADIRAQARKEAAVRAIEGYEEHETAIRGLLLQAETQLVLGNPWVRLEALLERLPGGNESWFDLLQRALARGVQIFLLWGIQADATLDLKVRNALVDLAERNPGRFLFALRSSTLHAKFVIRDAHQALVTSYNFLDPPIHRDSLEVGVLIEGTSPGVAPAAVLDLLEWARDAFPDYRQSQRLLLLPDELGAVEPSEPVVPLPPEVPKPGAVRGDAVGASPAIRHWATEWSAAHEKLQTLSLQHRHGAELVVDREHREALWSSLRSAERRLAILSDKLSADVVTDRFARHLRTRLAGGASCALVYRREGATDMADGPAARLLPLAQDYPDRFFLTEARSHAKILVSDDEVTIGSFNFLSYGGDYDGASGRRERAEISVCVREPAVVDKVLQVLSHHWPKAFAPLAARSKTAPTPALEHPVPPPLQPLFRELGAAADPGEPLLRWFGARAVPWNELEALEQARVAEPLLARAVGAAIAGAVDLDSEGGRRWRCWLAEYQWRQTDFIGSALLMPESDRGKLGLEAWLVRFAASVQAPTLPAVSLPEAEAMRAGQAQAAAFLVLVSALEQGRFDDLELLRGLEARLPGRFRAWAQAARTYYAEALQPLPMALLRRSVGQKQRREKIDQARAEFVRALESAENIGFRFQLGEHTWERLRMPDYLLGRMRGALSGDDPAGLGQYIAQLDEAGTDVERLMDDASYEERDEHLQKIDEPKRSNCLKRLRLMLKAARSWVELSVTPGMTAPEARVLKASGTLKRELAGLEVELGTLDPLAESVRRFALARLDPLFSAEEP
jgi:phosphatidylserine/phosphatidylglycerophosphate/cardiolipin synthase-like enzyme